MAINTDAVQRLYVAYFNRPADPAGLAHWEGQLPSTPATQAQLTAIAGSFSGSQEYTALYASQTNAQIVNSLYTHLFGRAAEPAGLAHWTARLAAGSETFASIALQLTYSAQGTDATAIANKLTAATAFTAALDTPAEIAGYSGLAAAASARSWLATVTDSAASLATATAGVGTAVSDAVAADTITLGTVFATYDTGAGNDIIIATVPQLNTGGATFNVINGGAGTDTLNITPTIDVAMTLDDSNFSKITGIEKIVIATTGTGAQTITTGTSFQTAFSAAGVDLTTTSTTGAMNIGMSSFAGGATLTTTSTTGAQTIVTGSGLTTVTATSTTGAQNISGAGLAKVTATSTTGAVTVTTDAGADVVTLTTADTAGNVITTNAGNDTITIVASGTAVSTVGNTITSGLGADTITLAADASIDTIVIGNTDSGITVATADSITGFTAANDALKMGTAGDATALTGTYVEAAAAVANFTAALTAANTALATLAGTSAATELYSFQFDTTNGYLFDDIDGDGDADQVVVLAGITAATIAAADIIA